MTGRKDNGNRRMGRYGVKKKKESFVRRNKKSYSGAL